MTPTAGGVNLYPAGGISGNWSLASGAYRTRGAGGACLLVEAKDVWPIKGADSPDCNPSESIQLDGTTCVTAARGIFGKGAWGYCHPQERKCWVKPARGTCNNSNISGIQGTPTRWELGNHLTNKTPFDFTKITLAQGWPVTTSWRVLACLREVDQQGKAGLLRCDWWGNPQEVSKNRPLSPSKTPCVEPGSC
jgi:hypothetical protein